MDNFKRYFFDSFFLENAVHISTKAGWEKRILSKLFKWNKIKISFKDFFVKINLLILSDMI